MIYQWFFFILVEIDYSHLHMTTFHDLINYWCINSSPVLLFFTNAIIYWLYIFCYTIHLASQPHCVTLQGCHWKHAVYVDHSIHQTSNGPFILYAYISILNHFYCDDFIFWKWQVIIKPNTESLCGMIKFSVVKIKWPRSQQNNSERPHVQRHWFWKYFCYSFSP